MLTPVNPTPVTGLVKLKVSVQLSFVAIQGLTARPFGSVYQLWTSWQLPALISGENETVKPVLGTLEVWLYEEKLSRVQPAGVVEFRVEPSVEVIVGTADEIDGTMSAYKKAVKRTARTFSAEATLTKNLT